MARQCCDEGDKADGDTKLAEAVQEWVVLLQFKNHHEEQPGHGSPQRNQEPQTEVDQIRPLGQEKLGGETVGGQPLQHEDQQVANVHQKDGAARHQPVGGVEQQHGENQAEVKTKTEIAAAQVLLESARLPKLDDGRQGAGGLQANE